MDHPQTMDWRHPRPERSCASLLTALLAGLFLASLASATDRYRPEPEATFEGAAAAPWVRVERHRDPHPRFPDEPFLPGLEQFFPPVKEAFGTSTPGAGQFLLHVAPGWDQATRPRPVLLIPGANDDATRRYAHPLSTRHPDFLETPGLMQHLAGRGFAVFSLSFSHYHGDNLYQGEHIANAIRRIRRLLNREGDPSFQVDLVTYSKGAMPARCYLQDAGQSYPGTRFLTPFRGDVRRVVFQCAPLAGIDMPFRYYLYNLNLAAGQVPAPMGASHVMTFGRMRPTGARNILSGMWTGQLQMTSDLRRIGIPHGPLSFTADGNMTARALIEGGKTAFLRSRGLKAAAEAGGNMIELLEKSGLPPGVSASLLGGTYPILEDERYPTLKIPAGFQFIAPNDGLLFLGSALRAESLTARGAQVVARKTMFLNHLGLSRDPRAYAWVEEQLTSE